MVICKFFLQGNCRFGENCKFEHQMNDGRQHHSSVLRQQNFTSNPPPAGNTNTTIDPNTLIRAVINDTLAAEKGGQWLLSCYAPFKEKPNFPGFEEQSFEEIRWGFYEAQHMGTANQFKQQFQMSLQAAILKLRSLQNPSQEAINTIKTIYNSSPGTPGNVFANSAAPSNFNSSSANMFGNNQSTMFNNTNTNNVFGQTGNFGNANVFAQNNQQQNSSAKSIFSTANQKLFGGPQQQQNSIFGGNQLANNGNFGSSGPFAQPFANQNQGFSAVQPNQQPSTFAQPPGSAGFGMQPQTVPFGTQQQTGTSPFHQQQSGISSFGAQPQTGNLAFADQQNTSPFGMQPQPNSALLGMQQTAALPFVTQQSGGLTLNASQPQNKTPFGIQQHQNTAGFGGQEISQVATSFGNPNNVFTNNVQQAQSHTSLSTSGSHTSSIFGSSNASTVIGRPENVADESIYSKLEELSESTIKSYESDNFEFGKIPEKPPTIQMCF